MRLLTALYIISALLMLSCSGRAGEVQSVGTSERLEPDAINDFLRDPRVKIGEKTFAVDLAISTDEKILGLMGRRSLRANEGMLFIYSEDIVPAFWMKGMLIPLDIIWIDAKLEVVSVSANVPPVGSSVTPPSYYPERAIRYVLEINAGLAFENGIGPGSRVEFMDVPLIPDSDYRIE